MAHLPSQPLSVSQPSRISSGHSLPVVRDARKPSSSLPSPSRTLVISRFREQPQQGEEPEPVEHKGFGSAEGKVHGKSDSGHSKQKGSKKPVEAAKIAEEFSAPSAPPVPTKTRGKKGKHLMTVGPPAARASPPPPDTPSSTTPDGTSSPTQSNQPLTSSSSSSSSSSSTAASAQPAAVELGEAVADAKLAKTEAAAPRGTVARSGIDTGDTDLDLPPELREEDERLQRGGKPRPAGDIERAMGAAMGAGSGGSTEEMAGSTSSDTSLSSGTYPPERSIHFYQAAAPPAPDHQPPSPTAASSSDSSTATITTHSNTRAAARAAAAAKKQPSDQHPPTSPRFTAADPAPQQQGQQQAPDQQAAAVLQEMRKDFSVDHSIDWGALTEQADTVLPPVASQDQGQQGQQQQKGPAWESQLAGEEQEAKLAGGDRLTDMQQQEQDEQEDETAMHRPRGSDPLADTYAEGAVDHPHDVPQDPLAVPESDPGMDKATSEWQMPRLLEHGPHVDAVRSERSHREEELGQIEQEEEQEEEREEQKKQQAKKASKHHTTQQQHKQQPQPPKQDDQHSKGVKAEHTAHDRLWPDQPRDSLPIEVQAADRLMASDSGAQVAGSAGVTMPGGHTSSRTSAQPVTPPPAAAVQGSSAAAQSSPPTPAGAQSGRAQRDKAAADGQQEVTRAEEYERELEKDEDDDEEEEYEVGSSTPSSNCFERSSSLEREEAEAEVRKLLNDPEEVIHELQSEPWGDQVSPEYVRGMVLAATHPEIGSIDNMAQQYNFDPRDPLPPHLTNGQAIPPPTPTTQTQDWEKPAALRSIATEGALEGVKQAKQLEQEAEQRRKEGGAAREAPAAATEGSPEPQTAGQLLEQLGMRGVDSTLHGSPTSEEDEQEIHELATQFTSKTGLTSSAFLEQLNRPRMREDGTPGCGECTDDQTDTEAPKQSGQFQQKGSYMAALSTPAAPLIQADDTEAMAQEMSDPGKMRDLSLLPPTENSTAPAAPVVQADDSEAMAQDGVDGQQSVTRASGHTSARPAPPPSTPLVSVDDSDAMAQESDLQQQNVRDLSLLATPGDAASHQQEGFTPPEGVVAQSDTDAMLVSLDGAAAEVMKESATIASPELTTSGARATESADEGEEEVKPLDEALEDAVHAAAEQQREREKVAAVHPAPHHEALLARAMLLQAAAAEVREVRDEINAVLSSLTTMKKALQVAAIGGLPVEQARALQKSMIRELARIGVELEEADAGMVNLAMAVTRLRDTGAVPVLDSIADYRAYLNGLITPPAQGQPEGGGEQQQPSEDGQGSEGKASENGTAQNSTAHSGTAEDSTTVGADASTSQEDQQHLQEERQKQDERTFPESIAGKMFAVAESVRNQVAYTLAADPAEAPGTATAEAVKEDVKPTASGKEDSNNHKRKEEKQWGTDVNKHTDESAGSKGEKKSDERDGRVTVTSGQQPRVGEPSAGAGAAEGQPELVTAAAAGVPAAASSAGPTLTPEAAAATKSVGDSGSSSSSGVGDIITGLTGALNLKPHEGVLGGKKDIRGGSGGGSGGGGGGGGGGIPRNRGSSGGGAEEPGKGLLSDPLSLVFLSIAAVGVAAGLSLGVNYLRNGHAQHVSDAHSRAGGLTPPLPPHTKGGSTSSGTLQHIKEEASHLAHAVVPKGGEGADSAGTVHAHAHHHAHVSSVPTKPVDDAALLPITTHQAVVAIRSSGPRAWPGIARSWATGAGRSVGRSLRGLPHMIQNSASGAGRSLRRLPQTLQQGASGASRGLRHVPGVLKQGAGGAARAVRTQVVALAGWARTAARDVRAHVEANPEVLLAVGGAAGTVALGAVPVRRASQRARTAAGKGGSSRRGASVKVKAKTPLPRAPGTPQGVSGPLPTHGHQDPGSRVLATADVLANGGALTSSAGGKARSRYLSPALNPMPESPQVGSVGRGGGEQ